MTPLDDDDVSRGYSRGNYANAYETEDYEAAVERIAEKGADYVAAFTLGFFSSYTLDEMGIHREAYEEAYFSRAGRRALALGYLDRESELEGEA